MKTPAVASITRTGLRREKGFALIITISLMVLLTLLALGLLTLSTVSLRSSGTGEAMREARANARLALELAIGQLQKAAGPDQRITAPANLERESAPLGVTGVWQASTAGDLVQPQGDKEDDFLTWLISDSLRSATSSGSQLDLTEPTMEGAVPLFGETSFGGEDSASDTSRQFIYTRPLQLGTDNSHGRLGWAVVDESTKARFDLEEPEELRDSASLARKISRSASPARLGVFALDRLDSLRPDEALVKKLASFDTAVLGTQTRALKEYRADVTPWSLSLMTNPVDGGFKRDLSTAISSSPQSFESEGNLYEHVGLPTDSDSDPSLATLVEYHDLYKSIGKRTSYTNNVRTDAIGANLPRGLRPYTGQGSRINPNPDVPEGMVLLPSLVRVDMIFSLVARDPHGPWVNPHKGLNNNYMIHLMFLPVVTVHNPYDTPLSFETMKISFRNIPVGFRFFNNNRPASRQLIPLADLVLSGFTGIDKEFGITLKQSLSGGGSNSVTLEPGQTRLFGTIGISPSWSWQSELNAGNNRVLFDWENNKTGGFDMLPGLMTDKHSGSGFDVDYIAPETYHTSYASQFCASGTFGAKRTDMISVEWGPALQSGAGSTPDFTITMDLNGRPAGVYKMAYGNEKNLEEVVSEGTSDRYPEPRDFPERWPDRDSRPVRAQEIYESPSTPFSRYVKAKPFGVLSFSGKTTRDSFVPARPYADSSTNLFVADMDVSSGKGAPGDQPYELAMVPVNPGAPTIGVNVDTNEGYFFGGHDENRGTPRATFYEIPRAPLQSLAQFRHANLANSGVPPFLTYTVGESWAHPLLPSNEVSGADPAGAGQIYDHTYLSNAALWDRYFLSTMADYEGTAFSGESKSAAEVRQEFFSNEGELLNSRFTSLVSTAEAEDAADEIGGSEGDRSAGKFLALKGGFNVNSTSEDAWVAFLSSMRETQIASQEDGLTDSGNSSPFPRVRYPAGGAIEGGDFFAERLPRWQGYRQLDEGQIRTLAENIVSEIRQRGPFLSLAEFVNRRLGSASDDASLRGVIASALLKSELNSTIEGDGIEISQANMGSHNWANPAAALGNNTEGAPGSLTQGDILTALGSQITVRGDTFVIRAYGESDSKQGRIQARAWCEAVVQRMPDFVDPADEPEADIEQITQMNETFGRRFEVLSFRWLVADEI